MNVQLRVLLCLAAALALLSTVAVAQSRTGTMSGVVKDAQGAVLRGVRVKVSSAALPGGARTTVTTETGAYRFAALPPGTFTVSFERAGFKTLKREGVTIQAALKTGVDAALGTGTMDGTVTVSGEARTIDAATERQIDASALDGVVLTIDRKVGDTEGGSVRVDGKTITGVDGARPSDR